MISHKDARRMINKWRAEADAFGVTFQSQHGYGADYEDLGREWALNKAADELEELIKEESDASE